MTNTTKNIYYINGNKETLFNGETDTHGIGLETETLGEIDYTEIEDYCHENELEWEVESDFRFWNGGHGSHNRHDQVSVGQYGTSDKHLRLLGGLLRKEIDRVVSEYNEVHA